MGGDYKRFLANLSPDIRIVNDDPLTINIGGHAPKQREVSAVWGQAGSKLEERFAAMWAALDGPPLEREYEFHATRKWRADFVHIKARVLIEIEGGTHSRGRHTRGYGFKNDCEKYNAATLGGWAVLRLTGEMIQSDAVQDFINFINGRCGHEASAERVDVAAGEVLAR